MAYYTLMYIIDACEDELRMDFFKKAYLIKALVNDKNYSLVDKLFHSDDNDADADGCYY